MRIGLRKASSGVIFVLSGNMELSSYLLLSEKSTGCSLGSQSRCPAFKFDWHRLIGVLLFSTAVASSVEIFKQNVLRIKIYENSIKISLNALSL